LLKQIFGKLDIILLDASHLDLACELMHDKYIAEIYRPVAIFRC